MKQRKKIIYTNYPVEVARAIIDDLLKEFPFRDERSKAVQVCAMLDQFCSHLRRPGDIPMEERKPYFSAWSQPPVICYSANSQRSGKTLLAKLSLAPVNGTPNIMSLPPREEELRKVLDSLVLSWSSHVIFDNIRHRIASPSLEAFLTTSVWTGRVLGKSESFRHHKRIFMRMTANQAEVSTDIAGRCLFCELWVGEGDPQERKISRVIPDDIFEDHEWRQNMLSAILGLIRHWYREGNRMGESLLVGYEQYSRVLGGIVQAAGYADPIAAPQLEEPADGDLRDISILLALMVERAATEPEGYLFSALVEMCVGLDLFLHMMDGRWVRPATQPDYYEMTRGAKVRFSRLLRGYRGRVFRTSVGRVRLDTTKPDNGREGVRYLPVLV